MKGMCFLFMLLFSATAFGSSAIGSPQPNAQLEQEVRELKDSVDKQTRIMQQQQQAEQNRKAQEQFNQIQNNSNQMVSGLNKYMAYPDVLAAAVELQEAQMAYLNTQQTRMAAGSIAAGIEGMADAFRAKKARKRISKAQKELAKAIKRADKDIAKNS